MQGPASASMDAGADQGHLNVEGIEEPTAFCSVLSVATPQLTSLPK
ncbi:hypothetical protein BL107_08741 [Synechococcus sp. BL107]|nr:hypothetical protein BL107_08741 [Synechococcus sp. BL107]